MQTDRLIVSAVSVYKNRVIKNGLTVFEKPGNAEEFLNGIYGYVETAYPKFHKMDPLCKLGFLAAEILLKGREHEKTYGPADTGIVLCNAHSSLDVDLRYAKTIQTGASPALFVYTLPNIVIGEISIRHHFKGENAFFVFKQFDGNFIAGYVNGLFDQHLISSCICGWVDIFREEYKATLFLIEQGEGKTGEVFTGEKLNQLNRFENG